MTADWLRSGAGGGTETTLHVQPGAARSEFARQHGAAFTLRVHAAAVGDAANAALTDFLAERLGRPRPTLRLLRGEKSRRKTVWVDRASAEVEHLLLENAHG